MRVLLDHLRKNVTLRGGVTVAALVLSFFSIWGAANRFPSLDTGSWNSRRPLPVDEVDFLIREELTEGLFNPYEWGGYLLHRLPGKDAVFIDGRNDLYGGRHSQTYLEIIGGHPRWKKDFDSWKVKTVLIRRDFGALASALDADPEWTGVYQGPVGLVFTRQEKP